MSNLMNQRLRFLVVEDEPLLLDANSEQVAEWFPGAEVIKATSGNEAQDQLKQNSNFNLIISDSQMPNGTGTELLKFCEESKLEVPVVIFHGGQTSREELKNASKNCVEIVTKPRLDELKEVAERIIN